MSTMLRKRKRVDLKIDRLVFYKYSSIEAPLHCQMLRLLFQHS